MSWKERLGFHANEFARGLKYGSSLVYTPVKWLSKVGSSLMGKFDDFVKKREGMPGHDWAKKISDSSVYKSVKGFVTDAGDFIEKDIPMYASMFDQEVLQPGLHYVNEWSGYVPQVNPSQMEGLGTRAMDGAPVSANRVVM